MYHHPGEYVTDFCIVKRDALYHLFHIRGERWTWPVGYRELDLGHATSTDLRTWTPHEPVLPAGPVGAWDECGNWAPDIIEVDGTYYCYYTGSDTNNNQAIGLATSTDLFHWQKHPANPVVSPGAWSDRHIGQDVAGRDAMVFADRPNGRYLLYYTATMSDGRACMALAESTNLIDWHDLGPTYIEEDRTYNRLESAYVVEQNERYYLFYSAKGGPKSKGFPPADYDHFDLVYLIGDTPTGPWQRPANHELLTESTCASEHPTFDGITYMLYIIQEEIEGLWGASVLSDPKQICWQADGTVQIHEHRPATLQRTDLFTGKTDGFAGWVGHGGQWTVDQDGVVNAPACVAASSVDAASDCFYMNTLWGKDLTLEGTVQLAADGVASFIVRGNPSAMAGYRITLAAAEGTIALTQLIPGQSDRCLQSRSVTLTPGQWHKLKVVVQGAFFELYLDDNLQIVRHHRAYVDGTFGLHARGAVRFGELQAYHLAGPESAATDWHQHCRPRHLFP